MTSFMGLQSFADSGLPEASARPDLTEALTNKDLLESSRDLQAQFAEHGSLKSPSVVEAKWIEKSLQQKMKSKEYQHYLESSGWNSSGGGGGRACFKTAKEASQALDGAGRMRREMIPKIQELVPYDYYSLVKNDYELWTDSLNEQGPITHPVRSDEDSAAYLRRNVIGTYGTYAPVFTETLIAVLDTLKFSAWQPLRDRGLPYYPDLEKGPTDAVKERQIPMAEHEETANPCVYVQLAIRYGGQFSKNDKPVQIVYDADLIDRMQQLSKSREDYIQKLSILILHESLYFMVKRSSPYGGEDVTQFIKDILLNKFDSEYFRYSYFARGRNLGRFMSLAMAEDYKQLLLKDAKMDPRLISRLTMFRAWYRHVFNVEILEWTENAKRGSLIPYFGWTGLEFQELTKYLTHPQAQVNLGPADAMASVLVSLSFNGVLSSPEVVFTRGSFAKNEIERACNYYGDFTNADLLTQVKSMRTEEQIANRENPVVTLKSTPEGVKAFFTLLRRFCQSSMETNQIEDKKSPLSISKSG
ncbi:MAG: hypothetical protein ACXVBQ_06030 [Pseudobdellovibrionaceae bacterium]